MIVPPRNREELARAIVALADMPELRGTLVRKARERVLNQITWEAYATSMLMAFENVLEERGRRAPAARREVFA